MDLNPPVTGRRVVVPSVAIIALGCYIATNARTIASALTNPLAAVGWLTSGILLGSALFVIHRWSRGRIGDSRLSRDGRRIVFAIAALSFVVAAATLFTGQSGTLIIVGASLVFAAQIVFRSRSELASPSSDGW